MEETGKLFSHAIVRGKSGQTLTEQVYEALRAEIRAGRWEVGDRMPSVDTLAEWSSITRTPISRAYQRLSKTGYIRSVRPNGTFLSSRDPQSSIRIGEVIGIAVPTDEIERGTSNLNPPYWLSKIIEFANSRGFSIEIKHLSRDEWLTVDTPEGPFSDKVKGIISLHPFEGDFTSKTRLQRIPLVHMGNSVDSMPYVRGDSRRAMYMLTEMVIAEGHRHIITFATPTRGRQEMEICFGGHRNAMRLAGLDPNLEAFERSFSLPPDDLTSVRAFLNDFKGATAIVVMGGNTPVRAILNVAGLMGIQIPDDFSMVCHRAGPPATEEGGPKVTCVQHNIEQEIDTCFKLLFDLIKERQSPLSGILIQPDAVKGETLTSPRKQSVLTSQIGSGASV